MEKENYIIVSKNNFFVELIVGFLILIAGGFYINDSSDIGFGMLGFGLAICLLLLEQRLNSIGFKRK